MAHVLYRFYSATGQLLYVGITMNPAQRFQSHRGTKDWWSDVVGITLEHYENRADLAESEKRAIQVEHPLHNVVRAKLKATQPVVAVNQPDDELDYSNLFPPAPPPTTAFNDILDGLFGRPDTSGDARAEARRARWDAIEACALCDDSGYRNMYVCDHIDHRPEAAREAQRTVQKESLQVIDGGS